MSTKIDPPPSVEPRKRIALLLNRLILASSARGYQQDREEVAVDRRITEADIEQLETRIQTDINALISSVQRDLIAQVQQMIEKIVVAPSQRGTWLSLKAHITKELASLAPEETPT